MDPNAAFEKLMDALAEAHEASEDLLEWFRKGGTIPQEMKGDFFSNPMNASFAMRLVSRGIADTITILAGKDE